MRANNHVFSGILFAAIEANQMSICFSVYFALSNALADTFSYSIASLLFIILSNVVNHKLWKFSHCVLATHTSKKLQPLVTQKLTKEHLKKYPILCVIFFL